MMMMMIIIIIIIEKIYKKMEFTTQARVSLVLAYFYKMN